ncbi:Gfo/Idh/MocA family protein [Robertmurraya andreesenii]|uniref:Dehydrogenase n=1 Tax=Anoxybacillus andreesenii TaxID=1325932 RepID=A0ABT9V8B7_9BACL|nr:Gfo/Idh/MocA family oxidoreductase [Robertmurraya andreesenii]MDQ0157186.1 putative dehydrogenase [Robertmurraya andreesenii]
MKVSQKVKWGILSTARCAKERLLPAIRAERNSELLAIGSRDIEKAKLVAENFGIHRVYGSYQEVIDDPEIDAIYIPLPNNMHKEWTIKAAKAGKHVLCEKPVALNVEEAEEMVAVCEKSDVLFMEAFAFRCHPQWHRLREILDSSHIGEIRNVNAHYSISVENPNDIRLNPNMGGGSLYDVGSYCINAIRFIMGEEPTEVHAISKFAPDNIVDLTSSVVMRFPGDRLAQFSSSIESTHKQVVEVTGTKGSIKISWPFRHPSLVIQKDAKEIMDVFEFQLDEYTEQVIHFVDCILTGKTLWYGPEESIKNMKVIEAIYESASHGTKLQLN